MKKFILLSVLCVVLGSGNGCGMEQEPIEEFKEGAVEKLEPALFFVYKISRVSSFGREPLVELSYGRQGYCSSSESLDGKTFLPSYHFPLKNFDHGRYVRSLMYNAKLQKLSLVVFFDSYAEPLQAFSFDSQYEPIGFNRFIKKKLAVTRIKNGIVPGEAAFFGGKEGNKRIAQRVVIVDWDPSTKGRMTKDQFSASKYISEEQFDLSELRSKKKQKEQDNQRD